MSDIRILVIFGNIPLHGQERANIQVMTCLKEAGHEVLFITHDRYGHEAIQPMLDKLGLSWTTATFPPRIDRGMSIRRWRRWLRRLVIHNREVSQIVRDFHPTHIHIANESHLLNLVLLLTRLRRPLIFRLGDKPRSHRLLFRLFWKYIYIPLVTHFVCISRYIRNELVNAGAPESKVSVIYNFPPDRPPVEPAGSLPPWDGATVTYVGQLREGKGVGVLFDAAIEMCRARDDVRFVFAGDYSWNNDFAQALVEKASEPELRDRIIFTGYVEDVPGLLRASTIHVCPSLWPEVLGNVVVEAKAAGVPSVVFPSGGLPELIEHEIDGYVCESKAQADLVKGLRHYLDRDADYAAAAGCRARESLLRLGITREKFTRAWRDVYEQVA